MAAPNSYLPLQVKGNYIVNTVKGNKIDSSFYLTTKLIGRRGLLAHHKRLSSLHSNAALNRNRLCNLRKQS